MSRRTPAKLLYRFCRTEKARGQRESYLMALCTGLGAPFCTDQQWRDLTARLARQWHHLTATQRAVTPYPGERMSPSTLYLLELVNGFTGPSAEQFAPESYLEPTKEAS